MKNAKNMWSLMVVGVASMALAGTALAQGAAAPAKPATEKPAQPAATPKHDEPKKHEDGAKKHDDAKKDEAKKDGVQPGQTAPDFKLTDTDGKTVTLAEHLKAGHVVVLQWFNPDCPFVKKHYQATKTFNELAAKYTGKVQFIAINSGAAGQEGSGQKRNAEAKKEWNIAYPIALDETGATGKTYGAKNTPFMVVINKDGKVVYTGAIDDDNGAEKPGKVNYVAKALDEVLAGSNVTTPTTKPYGCPVKYTKSKG